MCPLQDRNRLCVAKLRRSLDVGQGDVSSLRRLCVAKLRRSSDVGQGDVSSSGQEQVVCG